jgi:hypothetical protein
MREPLSAAMPARGQRRGAPPKSHGARSHAREPGATRRTLACKGPLGGVEASAAGRRPGPESHAQARDGPRSAGEPRSPNAAVPRPKRHAQRSAEGSPPLLAQTMQGQGRQVLLCESLLAILLHQLWAAKTRSRESFPPLTFVGQPVHDFPSIPLRPLLHAHL